ncbi:MAG TPA: hypothetical protein VL087_01425 [Nitrospirota bacterium]|nr:hypothetical protein [Nitrospirota bacterium]
MSPPTKSSSSGLQKSSARKRQHLRPGRSVEPEPETVKIFGAMARCSCHRQPARPADHSRGARFGPWREKTVALGAM